MNPLDFTEKDVSTWERNMDYYVQAIKETGIRRVIVLTGWIAHLLKDIHPEKKFEALKDVSITFMRPGPFYSNFYHYKEMIKEKGRIAANYGGEDLIAFVAPEDIAEAIADEINHPGQQVRNVASEELTCSQAAQIIGEAIGIPDLPWIAVSNEEAEQSLVAAGMSPAIAGLHLNRDLNTRSLFQNYSRRKRIVPRLNTGRPDSESTECSSGSCLM